MHYSNANPIRFNFKNNMNKKHSLLQLFKYVSEAQKSGKVFQSVTQTHANKALSFDESWNRDMKDLTAGEPVSSILFQLSINRSGESESKKQGQKDTEIKKARDRTVKEEST